MLSERQPHQEATSAFGVVRAILLCRCLFLNDPWICVQVGEFSVGGVVGEEASRVFRIQGAQQTFGWVDVYPTELSRELARFPAGALLPRCLRFGRQVNPAQAAVRISLAGADEPHLRDKPAHLAPPLPFAARPVRA